jgi:hypothetical protein
MDRLQELQHLWKNAKIITKNGRQKKARPKNLRITWRDVDILLSELSTQNEVDIDEEWTLEDDRKHSQGQDI